MNGSSIGRNWAATALAGAAALAVSSDAASARRIIWVQDSVETSYVKGFLSQNPEPNDLVKCESNGFMLADAMNILQSGDKLVVVAHGAEQPAGANGGAAQLKDGVFRGGVRVDGSTGSGTGSTCPPLDVPKIAFDNIEVELLVCYGATDPDGGGPMRSVVETFEDVFNGVDAIVQGATVAIDAGYNPVPKGAPTPQQIANTTDCLADAADAAGFAGPNRINDWIGSLPFPQNQMALDAAIGACLNDGDDVVNYNLVFFKPTPNSLGITATPVPRGASGAIELAPNTTSLCENGFCTAGGVIPVPASTENGVLALGAAFLLGSIGFAKIRAMRAA